MAKIISISNHKGGVGKTTSTVNLGAGLAKLKKKVLLIDLDPQANMSASLGIMEDGSNTIYEALQGKCKLQDTIVQKGKLQVVPACLNLADIELELSGKIARESFLKNLINEVKDNYDYILIDCPPSLGLLTINALTASDEVYIPLQAQFLPFQGLTKLSEVIELIKQGLNPNLELSGLFATHYDNRKVLNRNVVETVQEHFGDKLFKTKIRNNISLAEAPSMGEDIFSYSPDSNGAKDYLALSKEIIKRN